eukprot:COSAG02_NODE_855_length_16487_cov_19.113498_7_plen_295_part_00
MWLGGRHGAAAGGGQSDGRALYSCEPAAACLDQKSGRLGENSTAELPTAMGGTKSDEGVQTSETVGEQSLSDETLSEEVSDEEEDTLTEKYVCVKQAQARAGVAMESEKSCSVEVDEVVDVLQKVDIEDSKYGITVTRLQTSRGWVSEKTAAGNKLFRPADVEAIANASLRRAATLRGRAAARADAADSDDEDPFDDRKNSGCASCCCSFLRNIFLLVVALLLANLHYQLIDMSDVFMSAWYRVSASRVGLMQPSLAPPPPETPETTDPLFGADVFYPGLGRLGVPTPAAHADT